MNGDRRINPAGGCSDSQLDGNSRTQRLAEVHESLRIDVRTAQQIAACRARVHPQSALAGRSRVTAIPAIVEDEHCIAEPGERIGERGAVRAVSGVAIENQNCRFRCGSTADEPPVQCQAVGSRERYWNGALQSDRTADRGPAKTESR